MESNKGATGDGESRTVTCPQLLSLQISSLRHRLADRLLDVGCREREAGVFVITGQEARIGAGPAVVLSYAISGISALLFVLCYAEFGVEIPVAGGSFSYLRVELGDFIAFIAAGNILLEAIVGAAGLGRPCSSYLASLVKNDFDFFRIKVDSFAKGFDLLDSVVVAVLLVANGIAMSGTKGTKRTS